MNGWHGRNIQRFSTPRKKKKVFSLEGAKCWSSKNRVQSEMTLYLIRSEWKKDWWKMKIAFIKYHSASVTLKKKKMWTLKSIKCVEIIIIPLFTYLHVISSAQYKRSFVEHWLSLYRHKNNTFSEYVLLCSRVRQEWKSCRLETKWRWDFILMWTIH